MSERPDPTLGPCMVTVLRGELFPRLSGVAKPDVDLLSRVLKGLHELDTDGETTTPEEF